MANWTSRKTKTQRISKDTNFKSSQTITYGKGITNSQSFGGKNGRTTFSTGPKGTKVYTTIRNGEWFKRESRTLSSTKTPRIRKFRYRKGKPGEALTALFWIGLILLVIMVA